MSCTPAARIRARLTSGEDDGSRSTAQAPTDRRASRAATVSGPGSPANPTAVPGPTPARSSAVDASRICAASPAPVTRRRPATTTTSLPAWSRAASTRAASDAVGAVGGVGGACAAGAAPIAPGVIAGPPGGCPEPP